MINDRKFTVLLLDIINDIRIEPLEAESELKSYSQSYKKKRYVLFLRTIRDVLHISSDNGYYRLDQFQYLVIFEMSPSTSLTP